ncbi:MAG TPA: FGGY-family carbohydrate kinase, partial [Acidimicrobiales bacterium]|nr:FGGY-family carbohydrate kinase [Acidimicrobiales bacterium]
PHFSSPLTPMLLGGWDDKTLFASEGMVRSAGEMIPWAVSKGIASSISEFFSLVDTASDSGDLFVLPALHGLGTPYNDPEAVVLIQGESSSSSKGELAKAILEGIAFRMSEIVELSVESLGLESNAVLPIDGGLSRSDAFCQIQADLLGRPLVRHSIVEATVYGAAVAGGQGIGSDVYGSSQQGDIFEPIFTRDEADEKLSKWQKQVLPDK